MGAAELSGLARNPAGRRNAAIELVAAQVRDNVARHFSRARAAILAGSDQAITEACDSLIEHFQHSSELRRLVRVALSQGCDTTGREFLRILKDVMQMNAEHDAIRLEP